ncbi:MAG: small multidrug resistance protein [Bryobacterales bacterium]|nr:small multidrug resistance protein [Bryobacterales bacterium]
MKWLLVAVIVACTTVGEVLQAKGMRDQGEVDDFHPGALGRVFRAMARNRTIIASVVCMGISFFTFMALLSVADVSFAVPATAASYVLETVLAKLLLRERISSRRWAGALLVACGVALLSA